PGDLPRRPADGPGPRLHQRRVGSRRRTPGHHRPSAARTDGLGRGHEGSAACRQPVPRRRRHDRRPVRSTAALLPSLPSVADTAMKIGLVGFSGSGKSVAFHWLTGVTPDPAKIQQGQTGMAKVPDPRLDRMSALFQPKKTTYAEIAFLDTPGLDTAE